MAAPKADTLSFSGCNFFRQRLVLSTLSSRSVNIKRIRNKENNPGLAEFEANILRLLEQITNGSNIVVNETGTALLYQPGMLIGGELEFDCCPEKSIGWYLELLLQLAPFCKTPLRISLSGVTNNNDDASVDAIKLAYLPVLKRFLGTDEGLELKVNKRGAAPLGGGEVFFSCPTRQKLRPLHLTTPGKIKRIRGVAWATRVSPVTCNRIVDAARGVLNQFIPDIYIYTDHQRGAAAGKSPGFGLTLVAESTEDVFLCAEWCAEPHGLRENALTVEEIGQTGAQFLLEEIYRGGCVTSSAQTLACLFGVLGDRDVSKFAVGPLLPSTIQFLRDLKEFFGVTYKLDSVSAAKLAEIDDDENLRIGCDKVLLTAVGVGFRNLAKVVL